MAFFIPAGYANLKTRSVILVKMPSWGILLLMSLLQWSAESGKTFSLRFYFIFSQVQKCAGPDVV